jgi:hypothetical protein
MGNSAGSHAHTEEAATSLPAIQPRQQMIAPKPLARAERKLDLLERGEYPPRRPAHSAL